MLLERLINLEEKIVPIIDPAYFTLIAPANDATFEWFVERVYISARARSFTELLSDRTLVHAVLKTLNPEIDLRIYVIPKTTTNLLVRQTLDEFVEETHLKIPMEE